jgi:hypothetical protein
MTDANSIIHNSIQRLLTVKNQIQQTVDVITSCRLLVAIIENAPSEQGNLNVAQDVKVALLIDRLLTAGKLVLTLVGMEADRPSSLEM